MNQHNPNWNIHVDRGKSTINKDCVQMSKPYRISSFGNVLQDPNVINLQVTFVFQTVTKWPNLACVTIETHFDGKTSDEVEQHEWLGGSVVINRNMCQCNALCKRLGCVWYRQHCYRKCLIWVMSVNDERVRNVCSIFVGIPNREVWNVKKTSIQFKDKVNHKHYFIGLLNKNLVF